MLASKYLFQALAEARHRYFAEFNSHVDEESDPIAKRSYEIEHSLENQIHHFHTLNYVACGAILAHYDWCPVGGNFELEQELARALNPDLVVTEIRGEGFVYSLKHDLPRIREIIADINPGDDDHSHEWKIRDDISQENFGNHHFISMDFRVDEHMPYIVSEELFNWLDPVVISKVRAKFLTARRAIRAAYNKEMKVRIWMERAYDLAEFKRAYDFLHAEVIPV